MAFGQALRAAREEEGISQEELGFRSGVHRTYVSELERGEKCPTLTTVTRLATALKLKPSSLLASAETRCRK